MLAGWAEDKARYPRPSLLHEQSLWALLAYRLGRAVWAWPHGLRRTVALKACWTLHRVVETAVGISLPVGCTIGPGLRIHHFGGIFISNDSVLGAGCSLRQGVTVGNREEGGSSPVIGDDVELGAYAQVLGDITVGDGARIGAMSVVLQDVPAGARAVGIPARILD